jgi:hypothetical protein
MIGHNKPPHAEWEANPSGWIAISRELLDHPIVGAGKPVTPADQRRGAYSRMEAWVDLLRLAKYKSTRVPNRGRLVTLDAGQMVGSQRWLAERWNWTHKTVRHFLDVLVDDGMISFASAEVIHKGKGTESSHYNPAPASIITICNYSNYQLHRELITEHVKRVKGHSRGTVGAQKGAHSGAHSGAQNEADATKPEDVATSIACADGWVGEPVPQGHTKGPTEGHTQEPIRGTIITSNNTNNKNPPTPQEGVQMVGGRLTLFNGTRQFWLAEFGGDAKGLDLALIEASGSVQPNSRSHPLEAQVGRLLARIVRDKRDRDTRYQEATRRNAEKAAKPAKPTFRRY